LLTFTNNETILEVHQGGGDMYTIKPTMTFAEVVMYYDKYAKETRKQGRKPVSFLQFITGRY
jgi:hypothetical protein